MVSKSDLSSTVLSPSEEGHDEAGREGSVAVPPRPEPDARRSRWSTGRIAALVIGSLMVLVSLGLLGGSGTALWADLTKRDGGYVTTGIHEFSTSGSALETERIELGSAGTGWLYAPAMLGKVRIRVTPANSGSGLFVGIGPSTSVDRYLAGVSHTLISDFWGNRVQAVEGGTPGSSPGAQDFWVASSAGPGAQTLTWDAANGSWTVVVMNADGRPGIDVRTDLGASMRAVLWIAIGVLVGGGVFGLGGALLIAGAIRRRHE